MKVQYREVDLLHKKIWKILQNELAQKNEIIKSLMEIQSTVFVSLSDQQQKQQQQQQSQQLLEHNQQTMYEQHQPQIQQNQQTQNIQLTQQKVEPNNQNRSIYAVNLHINVTENDSYDFFALLSTKYLQEICKVDLLLCKKAGKSKGYAFLNVPDHVSSEVGKLNGVEFKSKQLVLKEAKTKHQDRTLDKKNSPG